MDNCIICLESNDDNFTRITTASSEWIEGNIQRIIEKHLWWWYLKPASPNDGHLRWICRQCWQKISTFHNFYCRVEKVHRYYQPIISILEQTNCSEQQKLQSLFVKQEFETTIESPTDLVLSDERHKGIRRKKFVIKDIEVEEVKIEFCVDANESNCDNDPMSFDAFEIQDVQDCKDDYNGLLEKEEEKPPENFNKKVKRPQKKKRKTKAVRKGKILQRKINRNKTMNPKDNSNGKVNEFDIFFKDGEYKFVCCICNMHLADFRMLKMHYRNEHNTKGYAMCCGKKYSKRCLLVDHLRVHKDPNFFKCQSCLKTFATRRGWEMHLETHESRERKYNCDECGKSYFKLHIFERHKLTHVPESERNFSCSQCDKKFAADYIRQQHEDLTHAKKYAKICDICGKTFCRSSSFLRHMEEHAGVERTLETCEICGAKLTNKYGLRQHMKMRHVEENLKEQICPYCSKTSPNLNAHRMHIKYTHTMQRKHACHLCDKAFRRPLELKEHLSTHTGEALYTCPHCPRTFISNANMHKHRKIAHRREWEESRSKKNENDRKGMDSIAVIDNGIKVTE